MKDRTRQRLLLGLLGATGALYFSLREPSREGIDLASGVDMAQMPAEPAPIMPNLCDCMRSYARRMRLVLRR